MLETLPGLRTSCADWEYQLGPEFSAILPLLRKTGKLAVELPSLGRHPSDGYFQLHQRDNGNYCGIAEDGTSTDFTRDDVQILELHLRDFKSRIAVAMGMTPTQAGDGDIVDAYLIAQYTHRGLPCPVYLVLTAEEEKFAAAVVSIVLGTTPAVIFTPTARRAGHLLNGPLPSNGVSLVALCDTFAIADGGVLVCNCSPSQLLPDAATRASRAPLQQDGVRDHTCIILGGVEHGVDLTEREMAFLRAAWDRDEVPLDELIHPKHGLISTKRFNNSPQNRNLISRFLKDLNFKLQRKARPQMLFGFTLPVRSMSVVRDKLR